LVTEVHYNNKVFSVDTDKGIDLSIRNDFSGRAPTFYGSEQPRYKALRSGNFVGNIKEGGSCNVPVVTLDIHCTGTHTESISHVIDSEVKISDVCPNGMIPAYLVSVELCEANKTNESYHSGIENDKLITKKELKDNTPGSCSGLIIRTIPNDDSKKTRDYDLKPAPFFTNDAIDHINELGVKHLLVDIPSIDKANDGGQLGNHKKFFKQGKTISELLFIPNDLKDGFGFLQIQIPNWGLDAAPSRPIFHSIK
tara:strand:- start:198 stop:956 length:759 start_codon:yes stop_codon:yes gene_type:complete